MQIDPTRYVLLLLVAGCGGGTVVDSNVAPPTAASGYATVESDITDPNEIQTRSAQLQHYIASSDNYEQRSYTVTISATGNEFNEFPEFLFTLDGIPVTMRWNTDDERFEGTNAGTEIHSYPWMITENAQASLGWITVFGDLGGMGLEVGGFNTDPNIVNARADIANYIGLGGISIVAEDGSFWAALDGEAVLIADFGKGTISGTVELTQNNGDGGLTIPATTLSLNETKITQNTFDGAATIDKAAFGLSDVGTIDVDGMFYEADATAVGGTLSGIGTATIENGGGTVFLNGAFLADE